MHVGIGIDIHLVTESERQNRAGGLEQREDDVFFAFERIGKQKFEVRAARWNVVADEDEGNRIALREDRGRARNDDNIELAFPGACDFDFDPFRIPQEVGQDRGAG